MYKGKLSVLLPAYNEEAVIYNSALLTAEKIAGFMEEYEVLVIDDGSTDNTIKEVRRAEQRNPAIRLVSYYPNAGKGNALRVGTEAAMGEYIAFCDADMELDPSQLEDYMQLLIKEKADVVIASKLHPDSQVDYPLIRRVCSYAYYLLLRIFFRLNTKDTQTGLKLFRAEKLKPVMKQVLVKRFAFDVEILSIIRSRGGKISSAPVKLNFKRGTFGRIKFGDVINMIIDTAAVFYRLKILHYYDRPNERENV